MKSYVLQVWVFAALLNLFEINTNHLCLPLFYCKGGTKEMYHLADVKNKATLLSNESQAKNITQNNDVYTVVINHKYQMKSFYCHYLSSCKVLANEHYCWKRVNTVIFTISQYANLGIDILMHSSSVALTWLSGWLEHSYFLLVTLLICCPLKVTVFIFNSMWSKLCFQNECIIEILDHSNSTCFLSSAVDCVEAQTVSTSYVENISLFRSFGDKKAEKELNRNVHKNNEAEASGLLHSSDSQHLSPVTTKHLSPTLEAAPKADLFGQQKSSDTKQNTVSIETTSYTTNILPGATASHDQHYETNVDTDVPPLSKEETRKNVRPVLKEDDVDSILQSYHKAQITPTAITNVLQPLVQDKTKPPVKTVPSSNVNKSHRSLPRRACLVHLKEQYHLDHDLLSQPRATKYLLKVRTEISPGRYMAKLELQCSRYVMFFCDGSYNRGCLHQLLLCSKFFVLVHLL